MTGVEIDNEIDASIARMKTSAERMLSMCGGDAEAAITAGLGAVLIIAHGVTPAERTIGDIIASLREYHSRLARLPAVVQATGVAS